MIIVEREARVVGDKFKYPWDGCNPNCFAELEVVEGEGDFCTGCYFHLNGCDRKRRDYTGSCSRCDRPDNKHIIFKYNGMSFR